jgi:hypothetical protein
MEFTLSNAIVVDFDSKYSKKITSIRNAVFTQEQNIDHKIDFDGQDITAIHVLVQKGSNYIATGRMLSDGHIGRIAVLKEFRGKGIGSKVVIALIEKAKCLGISRVYLGSQLHATDFYLKLDFLPYGEQYVEANIEHISMEILLH